MSIANSADLRAALACYRRESLGVRAFTRVRALLAPHEEVAQHVPVAGRVLDLGCGHGLFTNILALGSSERQLLGVEPSAAKLTVARRASAGLPNVRYQQGRIDDVSEAGFQAIAILDVLYLLPDEAKRAVLRACRARLAPDGVLLLKTNDTRPPWQYGVVWLEEEPAVRVLRFTLGGEIHFQGVPAYLELLREAGFEARVLPLNVAVPIPHRLFVCRPC
ncbi:MAG: class I SAM-dependent methyltransferase [Chloroflexi bacterium]|nr:class I SAM-dependent methyltransferase [Chloroflexota bacterium]